MESFKVHILGCGSALPTLKHNASSQIVEIRGKLFMIDCGEGTQIALRRSHIAFGRLSTVFLSHLHGDHCLGMIGMISTFGLLGRTQPLRIFAPAEFEPMLRSQLEMFCHNLEYEVDFHAVDTTQQPRIYIGGREVHLNNGLYGFNCGSTGDFTFNGYIEVPDRSGETLRRNFSQKYTVVAPSATVSADLMNVLYAGYNNPMSVSVPGVPLNQIVASMTGGTLTPTGPGKYIAKPEKPGTEATITVSSKANGGMQKMGEFKFRVRRLPDPTAYIAYKDAEGNNARYQGGRGFARSTLLSVGGIGAAIDDGLLNIEFKVVGFETTFFDDMGNAMPEISNSDRFTDQQKSMFQQMRRGRRFYISRVKAVGPDGSTRTLPQSLEVIVN